MGQTFGTRYHIIKVLGVGGMGAVYQAWDAELGEAVAIKVIRPEAIEDPAAAVDLEKRFKRELLLARQVTHKNVVRIHDLGEIEGTVSFYYKVSTGTWTDGVTSVPMSADSNVAAVTITVTPPGCAAPVTLANFGSVPLCLNGTTAQNVNALRLVQAVRARRAPPSRRRASTSPALRPASRSR